MRSMVVYYRAWDSTQAPKTGDAAHHTFALFSDGVAVTGFAPMATDLGGGLYAVTITAAYNAGSDMLLKITSSTSGVSCSAKEWRNDSATTLERATAIKAKTDQLGYGTVAVKSVTDSTGTITIWVGDDYTSAVDRSVAFTGDDTWPDLSTATIKLLLGKPAAFLVEIIGSRSIADGVQTVAFNPTHTATSTLTQTNTTRYAVRATMATGEVITLCSGNVQVNVVPSAS